MKKPQTRVPDLSDRLFGLAVEREFPLTPEVLFSAWTKGFDLWFAAPGSVLMQGEVDTVFFFETEYKFEEHALAKRHPHYGRFLQVIPNELVQLTWVTGAGGTEGAETVVTVELRKTGNGTVLKLSHDGFSTQAARDGHEHAWPIVLEHMENKLVSATSA